MTVRWWDKDGNALTYSYIAPSSMKSACALCLKQQEINKLFDLDKCDTQAAANDNVPQDEQDEGIFVERLAVERRKGRVVETAA